MDINALAKTFCGDIGLVCNDIEREMLGHEQEDCPVYHHFSPGIYVREVNLKADTFAIGHRQKKEHLNIFLKGSVTIVNDDKTTTKLVAPMIFTGKPGRKMGYIHEDVVWLNVYPTEETDIETLEGMFLDKSEGWKEAQKTPDIRGVDRDDYIKTISELGFTDEMVREQTENEDDQAPFPNGSYGVGVFNSDIQGKGLFATSPYRRDEMIAPARVGANRTPAGRYTNHAKAPNAEMRQVGGDVWLFALEAIPGCKGGQLGDEITVNYKDAVFLNKEISQCQV